MTEGHLELCQRMIQHDSQNKESETSVLVIGYSLVPRATYPVPVEESIWAMKYVLENLRKDPSRIILAGDSAGATLALDVTTHATHPFPGVPEYQKMGSARLRGLLLLSAWADFRLDMYRSYRAHESYDVLKLETLEMWSRKYLRSAAPGVWSAPCLAPSGWWNGLRVDNILLTAGGDECMRDVVIKLAETMRVSIIHSRFEC